MMISRVLRFLLAASALVYSIAPAAASPFSAPSEPTACGKPAYPRPPASPGPHRSAPDDEEGITFTAVLVRADGTVNRSVILNSSGSADLDSATNEALSTCVFKPATDGGKAIEGWAPFQYVWTFGDEGMRSAKHKAAVAAAKGDLAARYQLSLLLSSTAKTDADRQQALVVLRSAAELGSAPAQYDLGRRYEKGDRVSADIGEALRWYQKAAAQGDVLAIQRLQMGASAD